MDQMVSKESKDYKQMYRKMTQNKKDLKMFNLQVYLHKDSIKTVSTLPVINESDRRLPVTKR